MNESRPYPDQLVKLSPEVQQQSGYLFFCGAMNYKKAAAECCPELLNPIKAINSNEWVALHDPICNLYCHSIELMLKAFLIAHGVQEAALARKPYGHDLATLMRDARSFGLELTQDQIESIDHLALSYGKQPYVFRYPTLGKKNLNFFHLMLELVEDVAKATFPMVVRKARSMGVPVDEAEEAPRD